MTEKEGSGTANSGVSLRGVFAASVTPLQDDLLIDHALLTDHCRGLLARGCDGVSLFGTTGEATSFTREERIDALEAVVAAGIPPEKLLVGTGCCAVADTVALTRHAVGLGVGGVLLLPPFYYKNVSDDGLFDVYEQVLEGVGETRLRMYLYHFPRMTGVAISADLVGRLARAFPGWVVGIKDSSGDWENLRALCSLVPRIDVFPGSEAFLLAGLRAGAAGCISATANVMSPLAARVFRNRDDQTGDDLQTRLTAVRRAFEAYPLIAAVKYVMYRRSGLADWLHVRPPLRPLSGGGGERLVESLRDLGFWPIE